MDPRNIPEAQLEKMRGEMARTHRLDPYKQYSEQQSANFFGVDYTTAKRRRKKGGVPHVLYESGTVK